MLIGNSYSGEHQNFSLEIIIIYFADLQSSFSCMPSTKDCEAEIFLLVAMRKRQHRMAQDFVSLTLLFLKRKEFVFIAAIRYQMFRAFEVAIGEELWETKLETGLLTVPTTCRSETANNMCGYADWLRHPERSRKLATRSSGESKGPRAVRAEGVTIFCGGP
jgi:hypothetical protein